MIAQLAFLAKSELYEKEKPYSLYPLAGSDEQPATNAELTTEQVHLRDIRTFDPSIREHGFGVFKYPSGCSIFSSPKDVEQYKEEVNCLLQKVIADVDYVMTYNVAVCVKK